MTPVSHQTMNRVRVHAHTQYIVCMGIPSTFPSHVIPYFTVHTLQCTDYISKPGAEVQTL